MSTRGCYSYLAGKANRDETREFSALQPHTCIPRRIPWACTTCADSGNIHSFYAETALTFYTRSDRRPRRTCNRSPNWPGFQSTPCCRYSYQCTCPPPGRWWGLRRCWYMPRNWLQHADDRRGCL